MKNFKQMAKDVATKVGDLISPPEKFDPIYHNRTNSIMRTKETLRAQKIAEEQKQAKATTMKNEGRNL